MQTTADIRISPELLEDESHHRAELASVLGIMPEEITELALERRSIDARGRRPVYLLRYRVGVGEKLAHKAPEAAAFRDVTASEPAVVIGFGPAGMFAALRLIELGIRPIVLERGKPVRERRRDLAAITKRGEVDPDSNYCFGEGGAGTFSDGKLYTRSNKRGSIERVLRLFVRHGASESILIDAHPHIGTNKLPQVVQAIRETIMGHGGEVRFQSRVTSVEREASGRFRVCLGDGSEIEARGVILATGHSARDVFHMLDESAVLIERKPFSLGVRVEHPQSFVDDLQYHSPKRPANLPAASYSLVTQCAGRGVFSFCMCPGGIICPASTRSDEVVVNGWSPSKRNSRFANSGIVVEVRDEDLEPSSGALAGVQLQRRLERRAFELGGGKQVAPAQRLSDFVAGRISADLPECSYLPGVVPADLRALFPEAIGSRLRDGFRAFSASRNGFITDEAIVVAVESRTSSPVRIPRDKDTFMHPDAPGLFPVGEGAGYAGGIMSAAMDGENAATALAEYYRRKK